ncbi:hypothetical protein PNP85_05165 [Halobacterium salinarum]|uniref:hypothetical protein n=1 Tax=Halobacterium salinarum TaxID=2242 RepID=UPI0025545790|nr:hypothetical protein [Halobacterium salinarum]MDL0138889.1 hypothetical protein [Halobacterium salinarum]
MKPSDRTEQESVEQSNDQLGPELKECPVCGAVGLPERIDDHNCQSFLEQRGQYKLTEDDE